MDEKQELPDRCARGHRFYWLSHEDATAYMPEMWWGICAASKGRPDDRAFGSGEGKCRYPFRWESGRGLFACPDLNSEILCRAIRRLGWMVGVFDDAG